MGRATVALIHNRYQQAGGEDEVFAAEAGVLAEHGHHLVRYSLDNDAITGMPRLELAKSTMWNRGVRAELRALFQRERPSVAHFHNTFPLISPAAYYAARDAGVPVVQTLHNYRLICPNALLFRDGRPCERCIDTRTLWPGVVHSCYRGDRLATGMVASMVTLHRGLGTWANAVDVYIALSEFSRAKFIAGGLPASRIVVKPNFVGTDPGPGAHQGRYALYVGRLSAEKGLDTLLEAWPRMPKGTTLKIVGSGPLETLANGAPAGVEWLGRQPKATVLALMQEATCLVLPSACYENFPMTVVEAFATGLPVVASGHGAVAEIVTDGQTGRHFRPFDAEHLSHTMAALLADPDAARAMGRAARGEFEAKYTAATNYAALMEIYRRAGEQLAA